MKKRKFAWGGDVAFIPEIGMPGWEEFDGNLTPYAPPRAEGKATARGGLDMVGQGREIVGRGAQNVGQALDNIQESLGGGGGFGGGGSGSETPSPGMTMKKGGAVKGYAKGGSVSSASRRADGIAMRGKTRGRMV